MPTLRAVAPATPLGCASSWPAVLLAVLAATLATAALTPGPVLAQTKTPPPAAAQQVPAAAQPAVPGGPALAVLIQNTLLALNQANLTGNYSVLRDLATPAFQSVNTPA